MGGGDGASAAWAAALDAMQRAEQREAERGEAGEKAGEASGPISAPSSSRISERVVLVFDTETTGLSTATDRVVQLGAAYWRGGAQLGPPRGMLVDPGEGWG